MINAEVRIAKNYLFPLDSNVTPPVVVSAAEKASRREERIEHSIDANRGVEI